MNEPSVNSSTRNSIKITRQIGSYNPGPFEDFELAGWVENVLKHWNNTDTDGMIGELTYHLPEHVKFKDIRLRICPEFESLENKQADQGSEAFPSKGIPWREM